MGGSRGGVCVESFELGTREGGRASRGEDEIVNAKNLQELMAIEPQNVKKVLFVDDNLQFLEMIERLMGSWSQGEWQIFLAQNAGQPGRRRR